MIQVDLQSDGIIIDDPEGGGLYNQAEDEENYHTFTNEIIANLPADSRSMDLTVKFSEAKQIIKSLVW